MKFLKNGVWYGKSYYRLLIGNHTLAFDWCHFWWPWSTFEGHFSLGCHVHVHFSNHWHAFASHGLPAIAELLVLDDVVRRLPDGHTWLTASEVAERQSSQQFLRHSVSSNQSSRPCRRRRRMRPTRTSTTCSSCSSSVTAVSARLRSSFATRTIRSRRRSSARSASTSKSRPCSSRTNASNYRSGYTASFDSSCL